MINKTTRLGTAAFLWCATVRHDHEPQPGQPVRDEAGKGSKRAAAVSSGRSLPAPAHHVPRLRLRTYARLSEIGQLGTMPIRVHPGLPDQVVDAKAQAHGTQAPHLAARPDAVGSPRAAR